MENNEQKVCSGNCQECNFQQRVYCASYMARNNYAMIESVLNRLDAIQNDIFSLREKMSAMNVSDGDFIQPLDEDALKEKDTEGQAV